MALDLDELVDMFPGMARYKDAYLPITPIPRPLPGTAAMKGSNQPQGTSDGWLATMRSNFGNIREESIYSVGDVTEHLITDKPAILDGTPSKEGFHVYIVRGDLGDLKEQALYQASYARSVTTACVLGSNLPEQWQDKDDEGPSEELLEYLERPLVLDPMTPIHLQLTEGNNVPFLADRQSGVDVSRPKHLSAASSAALLLYQAAVHMVGPAEDPIPWYSRMYNAMPADLRAGQQDLVALLRDDQFDGFQSAVEIRDIEPSDPLYPLIFLNDAIYRS
jgi:hypothetical protein